MTERIITDSNGRKHITNEPQLHPPQRTWVGLTNDDWNSTPYDTEFRAGAEWAEAKLKEKNT